MTEPEYKEGYAQRQAGNGQRPRITITKDSTVEDVMRLEDAVLRPRMLFSESVAHEGGEGKAEPSGSAVNQQTQQDKAETR